MSGGIAGAPEHIDLVRDIPAPPDAVWPYVTDPARMNLWSEAKVTLIAPGADGTAASAGARRQVEIRALGLPVARLHEEVAAADPPRRIVYRVTGGVPVRSHQGTMTLEPTPDGGTRLRWQVDYRFAVPLAGAVAKRVLEAQLRASLGNLAGLFGGGPV